ncbi:MAG: YceI family protein [Salinivirgaceae bacterium]
MSKRVRNISLFFVLLFMGTWNLNAQVPLKLSAKSNMVVTGTSTLHDWESKVTNLQFSGTGKKENGKLSSIESLTITIPVKSIKSGKGIMDDKTYDALKSKQYPNIKFELVSAELSEGRIKAEGKLQIAGKSLLVPINASYSFNGNSELLVKGVHKIDMTRFDINPPTALMGSVTTGKDVTIPYEIIINY